MGLQALTQRTCSPENRISTHKLKLVMGWVLCGLLCSLLLAQETDTPRTASDTFSVGSAYFANNYANNADYAQFSLEVHKGAGRLALYGNDKFSNYLDGWVYRGVYLLGSTKLLDIAGISTTYHEWGHASRAAAMGSSAKLYKCSEYKDCDAPRNFFGYAASQVFNFKCGATLNDHEMTANSQSGRASGAIFSGAGVNNQTFVTERGAENHFVKGSDNVFSYFFSSSNQAIAGYGLGGDVIQIANEYRSKGVDSSISGEDLIEINKKSRWSGSFATLLMGAYDYAKTGNAQVKPWTVGGFLVPNQYNYISSRGITRKWVSGYEWDASTKILGSYEYVVRGDSFAEPGLGIYKNFGDWDALVKVSGKTLQWSNLETNFSKRINKNWKYFASAYMWDSRSLLGERQSLNFKVNKSSQVNVGVVYEY